jgi:hypothetical protein
VADRCIKNITQPLDHTFIVKDVFEYACLSQGLGFSPYPFECYSWNIVLFARLNVCQQRGVTYGHRTAGVKLDLYVAINIAIGLCTNMPTIYGGPAYFLGARSYKSRFLYVHLYRLFLMSLFETVIVYEVIVIFF